MNPATAYSWVSTRGSIKYQQCGESNEQLFFLVGQGLFD